MLKLPCTLVEAGEGGSSFGGCCSEMTGAGISLSGPLLCATPPPGDGYDKPQSDGSQYL